MAAKKSKSTSKGAKTMEELLAKTGYEFSSFRRTQRINAILKEVTDRMATFDVGGKTDGVLIDSYFAEARSLVKTLKPGDSVSAVVMDPETRDGSVLLSLRHATQDRLWNKLKEIKDKKETINVLGKRATDNGVIIEYDSVVGFIPYSQLGEAAAQDTESLVDKRFPVKLIEVDQERSRVVASERAVSEAADLEKLKKALTAVSEGDKFEGEVTTIAPFGIFVKVKVKRIAVEGLVHVSELSWGKVNHPSELYSVGDKVKVAVIGVDEGRLALSIKQAKEDPWGSVSGKYKAEDKVTGNVVRMSDFGVFIELEPGVEGLIHMTKIPPGTRFEKGQKVNCYVESVDNAERRISLGLVITTAKPVGYK